MWCIIYARVSPTVNKAPFVSHLQTIISLQPWINMFCLKFVFDSLYIYLFWLIKFNRYSLVAYAVSKVH